MNTLINQVESVVINLNAVLSSTSSDSFETSDKKRGVAIRDAVCNLNAVIKSMQHLDSKTSILIDKMIDNNNKLDTIINELKK